MCPSVHDYDLLVPVYKLRESVTRRSYHNPILMGRLGSTVLAGTLLMNVEYRNSDLKGITMFSLHGILSEKQPPASSISETTCKNSNKKLYYTRTRLMHKNTKYAQ